ncbi:helix-turn-helix domain-containing protein [Amycolatopsis rhabdoformis]|uniref:Helix-turn-helix domain-containing protein n=1 Tax=Amycolatopsis rhabdoformis TaxID=1448059 RepID=A0ABZ1IKH0_9PSEU|nr:helix-turn-helix domain-containing protein [Amycolatopsis rhabdoformis]WSE35024.1 helix-turn-helix domain-containing protein [Amycolatopsis rhabdoformis]
MTQFGRELRRIRGERALTLAALASLTHYSKGYLSKIETGTKPASTDLARRLDTALDAGGHLVRVLTAELARPRADVSPYRGLAAFSGEDSAWFFGRGDLIDEALETTRRAAGKPVVLVGPSGAGKSSLLHAGLLPALARGRVPGSASWPVLTLTPTDDPGAELARRAALVPDTAAERIVLVVDQFEELFTHSVTEATRTAFVRVLAGAAATGRALVVLALRADFYDRCLVYPELVDALRANQLTVGPMSPEQLREAITAPAEHAGLTLEPGLADLLLAEAEPDALPLLSHALLATWEEREGTTLTVAGYRRTGGIGDAVAATAERVHAALPQRARGAARALLVHLVRIGDHEPDARRRIERSTLRRQLPDPAGTELAVDALATARLLTVDKGTVTIAHEALLRAWPRLRGWIDSDRAGLQLQQRLRDAAQQWERGGRDRDLLYRGPRLDLAEDWATAHRDRLGSAEREFLAAARALEHSARFEARRRARRLRRLAVGLAVMTVLAVAATAVAVTQSVAASKARDEAVSRALASESNELRLTDPSLATRLSLAAYRVADTPEARGSLLDSSGDTQVRELDGHPSPIRRIAAIGGGDTVVTTGDDGSTRLWTVTGGASLVPAATIAGEGDEPTFAEAGGILVTTGKTGPTRVWRDGAWAAPVATFAAGPVTAAALSSDAAQLALGHPDGTISLWDTANPVAPTATLTGHTGAVVSLAFVPGSRVLVSGSEDFTARLWSPGRPGTVLGTTKAAVRSVAAAPGVIAVGSDDHSLALWSVTGVRTALLTSDTRAVHDLAFSPDGRTLAATGDDQTAQLWNVAEGTSLTVLNQPAPVRGAAFAAHGGLLVTGDDVGHLWLWHLPPPVVTVAAGVNSVVYRPRGDGYALGEDDGTVQLRLGGRVTNLVTGGAAIRTVVFSPDGAVLAAGGEDGVVHLWSLTGGEAAALARFPTGDGQLGAVAFDPTGRVLATGGDGRVVRLWIVGRTPALLDELRGHDNTIWGLAFSPDGATLASSGDDYTARFWHVRDPRHATAAGKLPWLPNSVNTVAFSPDGRLLATGGDDHTVRVWDFTTSPPTQWAELTAHGDAVQSVAFSPDGRLLASSADDHTARLWDVTDPHAPVALANLTGHTDVVGSVAFSPDGARLATAGTDHAVRFWLTDAAASARTICASSVPALSADEWSRYAAGAAPRPLC